MSTKITPRSFEWRCDQCGMRGRKEPHLRLRDHMERTHNKVWDDEKQDFISQPNTVVRTTESLRTSVERGGRAMSPIGKLEHLPKTDADMTAIEKEGNHDS